MKNPVTPLRRLSLVEAISFLVLLGIAMPLKYIWGMPLAVRIVGMIHGLLFLAFCWGLNNVLSHTRWPFSRVVLVFIASFIPFVPFFLDRKMKIWEADEQRGGS
ncbi:MAG: DUF3817 domain-containing protein [Verrucomicrobiaceae bacterium]|nr:DUF3817 domain-containing protein [Verrucomicrobiaceae bacterium]